MKNKLFHGNDDWPNYDLGTENELLKLKLKAEFGAECTTAHADIPDEVVNEFLQAVYLFESQFRKGSRPISIHQMLGKPVIRYVEELSDKELSAEFGRIEELMKRNGVHLDVMGSYSLRHIYRFITEEFMWTEVEDVHLPGFVHHFCYEDFHRSEEMDIRQRMLEFLTAWFGRQFIEDDGEIQRSFFTQRLQERVGRDLKQIQRVFDAYKTFNNCEYMVTGIMKEAGQASGDGLLVVVMGKVRYDAELENGDRLHVEDKMEVTLQQFSDEWRINGFCLPGWDLQEDVD